MNRFETQKMASGGLALILEKVSRWEDFSEYSKKWINKLNAFVLSKPVISVDECLVEVKIENVEFWITYDDFQSAIHLEPKEKKFNQIILSLQKRLKNST